MSTETREMILGARAFQVPALPLAATMRAYPLLRRMHNGGFFDRWMTEGEGPTDQDMVDVSAVLFLCAQAASSDLTREDFDALPATPAQLFDGYMVARFQCGGWVEAQAGADAGEAPGEPKPPISTSAASSES